MLLDIHKWSSDCSEPIYCRFSAAEHTTINRGSWNDEQCYLPGARRTAARCRPRLRQRRQRPGCEYGVTAWSLRTPRRRDRRRCSGWRTRARSARRWPYGRSLPVARRRRCSRTTRGRRAGARCTGRRPAERRRRRLRRAVASRRRPCTAAGGRPRRRHRSCAGDRTRRRTWRCRPGRTRWTHRSTPYTRRTRTADTTRCRPMTSLPRHVVRSHVLSSPSSL